MKLGKLLATGRSIMNWRGVIEYRPNKKVYVPRFEPPKSLFDQPVVVVRPELEPAVPEPKLGGAVKLLVATRRAQPVVVVDPAALREPHWRAWLRSWFARPEPAQREVQIEMKLDAVKVIRNDLRDAELEETPGKSRAAQPGPALEPVPTWNEVGEKFFGADVV